MGVVVAITDVYTINNWLLFFVRLLLPIFLLIWYRYVWTIPAFHSLVSFSFN